MIIIIMLITIEIKGMEVANCVSLLLVVDQTGVRRATPAPRHVTPTDVWAAAFSPIAN